MRTLRALSLTALLIAGLLLPLPSTAGCPECNEKLIEAFRMKVTTEGIHRYSDWIRSATSLTFRELRTMIDKGHSEGGLSAKIPVPIAEAVFQIGLNMFFAGNQDWQDTHFVSQVFGNAHDQGREEEVMSKLAVDMVDPRALDAYNACLRNCDPLWIEPEAGGNPNEFVVRIEWAPKAGHQAELLINQVGQTNCNVTSPAEAQSVSASAPIKLSFASNRPSVVVTFRRVNASEPCVVDIETSAGGKKFVLASELKPVSIDARNSAGTRTGLLVRPNDRVNVAIHGTWYPGGGQPWVDARGGHPGYLTPDIQATLVCPSATFATVVAKVGDRVVPIVGDRFIAPEEGEVVLLFNDTPTTGYDDNRGTIAATCWKEGASQ